MTQYDTLRHGVLYMSGWVMITMPLEIIDLLDVAFHYST